LYLQRKSKFASKYEKGMKKNEYWSYYFDDAITLLAKLP
jgi:citrate synthase